MTGIPSTLRIAGDLTPQLLDQIRAGLGEPGDWDATVVAALVAKLDDYRARLVKAEADLLNVRGVLSPNGHPRRVPMELVPTVAPAVEWLVGEIDRLRAKYEPPVPDGLRTASDWCALYGLIVVDPAGWPSSGRPHWTDPISLTDFAERIARSTVEGRGLARLMEDAKRAGAR